MKQKILITGGSGFVGKYLIDELKQLDNVSITVVSRNFIGPNCDRIDYHQVDYVDFIKSCNTIFDFVFHFAWSSVPSSSYNLPIDDIHDNLIKSYLFYQQCANLKVKNIIFLSTGGAMFSDYNNRAINELHTPSPKGVYGINKLTTELYLKSLTKNTSSNYIIFRCSNIYGFGQNLSKPIGFINHALNSIVSNQPLTVYGDGTVVRDFIHIKDVISALKMVLQNRIKFNQIYNLSTCIGFSINQIISLINIITNKKLKINRESNRIFDVDSVVLDNRKLLNQGWTINENIDDGIRTIYQQIVDKKIIS